VSSGSVNLQRLQTSLREGEALVDIYKFDQFDHTSASHPAYAAVITGRTAAPRFVKIGSAKEVEKLVAQWLDGVAADHSDDAWTALREAVWDPLLAALPQGTRVARVSGDADLIRIPWHTFTERDTAKHPLDVVEVSSPRSLVEFRLRSQPVDVHDRLIVVGGLDYDAGRTPRTPGYRNMPFESLRWAADESKGIDSLARGNGIRSLWLRGAAATKDAVLEQIKSSTYLHFATHGFVPNDSGTGPIVSWDEGGPFGRSPLLESGIALSAANVRDPVTLQNDGILTAEEILNADMAHAKLVILSACKTGLGVKASGQGILGLRSSLQAAGAQRIVMSLWNVDVEATKILMSRFYRNLWVDGMPLLAAFHEAQESVRKAHRFRAPRFWAGWSIIDPS